MTSDDRPDPDRAVRANRALWDAWTRLHREGVSDFYDVEGFLAGKDPLNEIELRELGDVSGLRFLHLQCHLGVDTLAWARRGAVVTGVDFSPEAVATARDLAARAGLDARFVESDVYALEEHGLGTFDVVHTSYGVLAWLPDLPDWARIVAAHLRPGGRFHMVENHPLAEMLDDGGRRIRWPYLATGRSLALPVEGSYADPEADLDLTEHTWPHGLGETVTALLDAGLRLDWLREHTRTPYPYPSWVEPRPGGGYGAPGGREDLPLLFSLGARRP